RLERTKAARAHRGNNASEDIPGPSAGQPCWSRRREAEAAIGRSDKRVRPFVDDHGVGSAGCFQSALGLGPGEIAEQPPKLAFVGSDDGILAVKALRHTEMGDRIGVQYLRGLRRERHRQHFREVAEARAYKEAADACVV